MTSIVVNNAYFRTSKSVILCLFSCASPNIRYLEFKFHTLVEHDIVYILIFFSDLCRTLKYSSRFFFKKSYNSVYKNPLSKVYSNVTIWICVPGEIKTWQKGHGRNEIYASLYSVGRGKGVPQAVSSSQ
jgi:hypothetical protein